MYSLAVKNKTTQFIKDYGRGIAQAIKGTGLFFPTIVAQKALESGWGTSSLTKEANNFGGIKYAPNLPGVIGFVTKDTTEYVRGRRVNVKARFSKFKDVESGIRATITVLLNDRYKNARLNAKTPEEQVLMIVRAGYSTTPAQKYLASLQGIIEATQDLTGLGRIY
jgi:flagellum-specific peptidoglycan hydrolase FlgJ